MTVWKLNLAMNSVVKQRMEAGRAGGNGVNVNVITKQEQELKTE